MTTSFIRQVVQQGRRYDGAFTLAEPDRTTSVAFVEGIPAILDMSGRQGDATWGIHTSSSSTNMSIDTPTYSLYALYQGTQRYLKITAPDSADILLLTSFDTVYPQIDDIPDSALRRDLLAIASYMKDPQRILEGEVPPIPSLQHIPTTTVQIPFLQQAAIQSGQYDRALIVPRRDTLYDLHGLIIRTDDYMLQIDGDRILLQMEIVDNGRYAVQIERNGDTLRVDAPVPLSSLQQEMLKILMSRDILLGTENPQIVSRTQGIFTLPTNMEEFLESFAQQQLMSIYIWRSGTAHIHGHLGQDGLKSYTYTQGNGITLSYKRMDGGFESSVSSGIQVLTYSSATDQYVMRHNLGGFSFGTAEAIYNDPSAIPGILQTYAPLLSNEQEMLAQMPALENAITTTTFYEM